MRNKYQYQISNVKCQMCWAFGIGIYLTLVLFDIPKLAWAATPSPSPNALTEFQQKVNDIKKEAASKAATLKTEVAQTIQNKAYIGNISNIQGKQFTVQAAKGTRTINTDEYTVFQDSTKKTINLKDLKKDDFIVALGDVDDSKAMKAKKVIKSKVPAVTEKYVVWGQLQSIVVNTLTLLKNDNQKVTLNTNSNTTFRLGSDEAKLQSLKTGNFIISVGTKLNNNSSNSQFIYLLNPKGDLKIEKPASASATPSASPKVK